MLVAPDRCDLLSEGGDMMDSIRQYIVSIISASIVCAVLKTLLGKSAYSRIVQILCGTFLVFTFLAPLKHIDLQDAILSFQWDGNISEDAIQRGEDMSRKAIADIISSEVASYVVEKAASFGAEVHVEVTVSDEEIPAPVGIDIIGRLSPYIRSQLEEIISEDIGLTREDMRWNGQY